MPSFLTAILGLVLVTQTQAHLSIINIYGSNDNVGHAFGVNLQGKYPRVVGAPGDAGGDSGLFQTGTNNPSPACGSTPELGPLDIPAWLDQAEGFGLPAAYPNMSVVMDVFQVNRDGGGPMSCEYNDDATATSWRPMFISLNQAGNSGIENQQRVNSTVVANFPKDATCTGGFTQTACIVRCRTGVNRRFGGCFAVKLSNSEPFSASISASINLNSTIGASLNSATVSRVTADASSDSDVALSDQDIDRIAQKVIAAMQSSGFLISAAAVDSLHNSSMSVTNSSSGAISHLVQISQSASNISSSSSGGNPTDTFDASDAADAADVAAASGASGASNISNAANATDASDIADAAFYRAENETQNGTIMTNTSGSNSDLSNVSTKNSTEQPSTTSKSASGRSTRRSCGAHKKRLSKTFSR